MPPESRQTRVGDRCGENDNRANPRRPPSRSDDSGSILADANNHFPSRIFARVCEAQFFRGHGPGSFWGARRQERRPESSGCRSLWGATDSLDCRAPKQRREVVGWARSSMLCRAGGIVVDSRGVVLCVFPRSFAFLGKWASDPVRLSGEARGETDRNEKARPARDSDSGRSPSRI